MDQKPISYRAFGRNYDVSDTTIKFYIKKEYITQDCIVINQKNKRPGLIEEKAVKSIRDNYKSDWGLSVSSTVETKAITEKPKKEAAVKNNEGKTDHSGINANKHESPATIKLEIEKVKLAKETLSLKEKEGELVSMREVQKALYEKGSDVKTKLQSIPARVVDNVMAAALVSRNEVLNVLADAIDEELLKIGEVSDFKIKRS